jgi:two-component system sensor histidine kinase KdpD
MHRVRITSISILLPYVLALLAIAVTTGLFFLLHIESNTPIVALLYLLPVGLSTALLGLWPGVASALGAFLAFNYFFLSPAYTLIVHRPQDVLALVIFLVVAVTISQLVGGAKAGLIAATARERESTRLYELSTMLAGLHEDQAIARAIAAQAYETFGADHVEVGVEARSGDEPLNVILPPGSAALSAAPTLVVPLMTARGLQGEIRVWRSRSTLTPSEDRLLRTFASQGALALERSRLARSETRAKVLEESDRLKSALLSSVSHELRTPLATIKAAVTSLRSDQVPLDSAAGQDLLVQIDEETDYLNQLVGNILDMSRIESGALNPQLKWNVLAEIVGSVLTRMRQATQQHQIELDLPDDLPLVLVDYVQLEQVFSNLISNGLKYAPPQTAIRIWARVQNDRTLLVTVSNQGPPVPEEHLDRIFDKFYRITAADRVTGTGLGLSICKGIIEAHGGRIWARNLPEGLAFNFTLPLSSENLQPSVPLEAESV